MASPTGLAAAGVSGQADKSEHVSTLIMYR